MTQKHSPLPWILEKDGKGSIVRNGEKRIISTYSMDYCSMDEANENAAFIVRACNSHDALVEVLEGAEGRLSSLLSSLGWSDSDIKNDAQISSFRHALALAKGE